MTMPLSEQDRQRTAAQWQRENRSQTNFTKAELRGALDGIDDWVDANQASFNQAIPAGVRSRMTTDQKIDLFMYILMRRRGRLKAEED